MKLVNGILCCSDGLRKDLDISIIDGKIRLEKAKPESRDLDNANQDIVDLQESYVLPGFIEIHTHGAGLFDFTDGKYNPEDHSYDASEEAYSKGLLEYSKLRVSTGATGIYLGSLAAPVPQLQHCYKMLRNHMDSGSNGKDGSLILGGFLEGTFLNPAMAGAQNPEYTFRPDIEVFERINESGVIKLANVVPDYGEKSYALTRHLKSKGISVGAGHTAATCQQFEEAISHGLKYFIHLLNGPTGNSYKFFDGGGALEAALKNDIYAEIIPDGIHVNPAYVRDVIARKGSDRIMAISDAMFSSQAEAVKEFVIAGIKGKVDPENKYVYVEGSKPMALFSTLMGMDTAFSNMLSWLTQDMGGIWYPKHKALGFAEAVTIASRCCSGNIAGMIGSDADDLITGSIESGKWADLVIAEINGSAGNYKLNVNQVYVRGNKV